MTTLFDLVNNTADLEIMVDLEADRVEIELNCDKTWKEEADRIEAYADNIGNGECDTDYLNFAVFLRLAEEKWFALEDGDVF